MPLASVARAGARVGDGYGRTVTTRGTYESEHEVRIPVAEGADTVRVVTLLRQDDGDALAVVRGVVSGSDRAAPAGRAAGPGGSPAAVGGGGRLPAEGADLASVRVAQLAQLWPGPLVDGFVVLTPADAQAQGLTPADARLPEARGRLRNGAYALQWWLFAGVHRGHVDPDRPRRRSTARRRVAARTTRWPPTARPASADLDG